MTGDEPDQLSVNGKVEKRTAYRQKQEARLEGSRARLAAVMARITAEMTGSPGELGEQIPKAQHQVASHLATVERRLARLGQASEETWEDCKKELERAWDDLSQSVKNFVSRITR